VRQPLRRCGTGRQDTYKALLQENDESRKRIHDMRGAVPLVFRRPAAQKVKLDSDELRSENSRLTAYIVSFEHSEFVKRVAHKRQSAHRVLSTLVGDGVVEHADGTRATLWTRDSEQAGCTTPRLVSGGLAMPASVKRIVDDPL
jgi:hypothetical protein